MEEVRGNQKSIFKEWWFYLVIVVFLFVIYLMFPRSSNSYTGLDTFATCLTSKGVKMFGTEWCSHCKNQKEMFGSSFKKIDYVDCDFRKEECMSMLVTGYPTWRINGQNYPGEQTLESLSNLSGCELVRG
jgi:glutaredoxin